ncbi:Nucleolar GTP-binding protein 1, partial [Tilletia horrida]
YLLEDEEWKYDVISEVWEGKNVANFVDPDILERLDALEREEERLDAEGFYDDLEGEGEEDEDEETLALREAAEAIEAREAAAHATSQHKKKNKNRRVIPRKLQNRTLGFERGKRLAEDEVDEDMAEGDDPWQDEDGTTMMQDKVGGASSHPFRARKHRF